MANAIWKMENENISKSLHNGRYQHILLAGAEQRCTYPDERGPFRDCDLEIVAHSHREVVESPFGGAGLPSFIAQAAQMLKERPRVLRVIGERRHGHQSF